VWGGDYEFGSLEDVGTLGRSRPGLSFVRGQWMMAAFVNQN
jgi:hypothetical protein